MRRSCCPRSPRYVDVPFHRVGTLVLVPARIEGGDERWFLLDTGAGIHVLDRAVADSIGLFGGAAITATGTAGTAPAMMLGGLRVQVGDVYATQQRVMVLPLGPLSAQIGHPVAGILGFDLLRLFATTFDYARGIVRFEAPGAYVPPDAALVLPMEVVEGRPFVDAWLGQASARPATGRFLIDTGYDGAVSVNSPFVEAYGILNGLGATQEGRVAGVGGSSTAVSGRIAALGIGPLRFDAPVATLSRATSGASASSASAGLLGGELFARMTITTDYEAGRFIATCTAACTDPFEADMSGLVAPRRIRRPPRRRRPRRVGRRHGGRRPGDLVTHVDGRPVAEIGLMETRRLLRRRRRRARAHARPRRRDAHRHAPPAPARVRAPPASARWTRSEAVLPRIRGRCRAATEEESLRPDAVERVLGGAHDGEAPPVRRADEALAFEAVEEGDEVVEEAVGREQRDGLVVVAERAEREHLEELLQGADAAGEHDERVRLREHDALALAHRLGHDHLVGGIIGDALARLERLRDHADHAPACRVRRPRHDAHEPDRPAAVDERVPARGEFLPEGFGHASVAVNRGGGGGAVDGDVHHGREWLLLTPADAHGDSGLGFRG